MHNNLQYIRRFLQLTRFITGASALAESAKIVKMTRFCQLTQTALEDFKHSMENVTTYVTLQ